MMLNRSFKGAMDGKPLSFLINVRLTRTEAFIYACTERLEKAISIGQRGLL